MKQVTSNGGQIRFRVPERWLSEPEDRGMMFFAPEEDSGTLRISVLTFQAPDQDSARKCGLRNTAERVGRPVETLPTGAYFLRFVEIADQEGERLAMAHWQTQYVNGTEVLLALYSYTLLESQASMPAFHAEIEMLDAEIRAAEVVT